MPNSVQNTNTTTHGVVTHVFAKATLMDEVYKIADPLLRHMVVTQLQTAPPWFWKVSSSSTGKYHSADSRLDGGLVIHTLKVVWLAVRLGRSYDLQEDRLRAAAAIHDTYKFGDQNGVEVGKDRPIYQQHGLVASERLMEIFEGVPATLLGAADYDHSLYDYEKLKRQVKEICQAVKTHMGKWGRYKPKSRLDHVIHAADMCASDPHLIADCFMMAVLADRKNSN